MKKINPTFVLLLSLYFFKFNVHSSIIDEVITLDKASKKMGDYQYVENLFNKFQTLYRDQFESLGGRLTFIIDRDSDVVNAHVKREGSLWKIIVNAGLIDHRHTTNGVLQMILCHEIGHHIGGQPYKSGQNDWVSVEGQADYFATTSCLKKLFKRFPKEAPRTLDFSRTVAEQMREHCKKSRGNKLESQLCEKIIMISKQTTDFLYKIGHTRRGPRGVRAKYENFDETIVQVTMEQHPNRQCRLDTFIAGALCNQGAEQSFHENCYRDSKKGSLVSRNAYRPFCWFYHE